MHQPKYAAPASGVRRHTGPRSGGSPLPSILFFPAAIFYHELLIRAFDQEASFFTMALLRILLFSIAAGLLLFLILDVLPWRKTARIIGGVVLGAGTVVFCVERGCRSMFGLYYGAGFMGGMTGEVMTSFASTVWMGFLSIIPFVLLALIPFVLYVIFCRRLVAQERQKGLLRLAPAAAMAACQLAAFLLSFLGGAKNYYTYDFSPNASIPQFGVVSSLRLELEYAVFGTPETPLEVLWPEPAESLEPAETPDVGGEPTEDPTASPVVYGYNIMDIDFEVLAESAPNETLETMHRYFGSLTPSQQNEYTGMFEGKNLILITAEAFCTYAIDEELTPTLYKLANSGFVFRNFYQPDWTQSTSGGEFAVMTGLIPNWIGGTTAFKASIGTYMPLALGWQFGKLGYSTPAWYDHTYDYYGRDETHPNLGYDYVGVGSGLVLESMADDPEQWPKSDLEMMQATVDGYIDDYVNSGTNFHAYYMTVSGHGLYSWGGNAMSKKHREEVEAKYPDLSETVQAYLACSMELDQALEYLVERLEAAGIADDTVIVMTGDHYPYLMVDAANDVDYYNELRGFADTEADTSRYRNTLILWSGCMEEPVIVDTPCSSIDIVPTLSNLFGLEYDSRLYSGRDVFAANYEADRASTCMPLVVFANTGFGNSWITAAGTYEASTGTFTPNEGITVDDDYVSTVSRIVSAKYSYAKLIIQEDYYRAVLEE